MRGDNLPVIPVAAPESNPGRNPSFLTGRTGPPCWLSVRLVFCQAVPWGHQRILNDAGRCHDLSSRSFS